MNLENENKGGELPHAAVSPLRAPQRRAGDRAALQPGEQAAAPGEQAAAPAAGPLTADRRRAERRQISALIAWWGEAERRSGRDQRASPAGNDSEAEKR